MDKDRGKHPELECDYTFDWDAEVAGVLHQLVYTRPEMLAVTNIHSGYTYYVPTKGLFGEGERDA